MKPVKGKFQIVRRVAGTDQVHSYVGLEHSDRITANGICGDLSRAASVGHDSLTTDRLYYDVMTMAVEPAPSPLERAIADQRAWILSCGGNLKGYIGKYGRKEDPDHYGDGAEAIYKADTDELARLEARLPKQRA